MFTYLSQFYTHFGGDIWTYPQVHLHAAWNGVERLYKSHPWFPQWIVRLAILSRWHKNEGTSKRLRKMEFKGSVFWNKNFEILACEYTLGTCVQIRTRFCLAPATRWLFPSTCFCIDPCRSIRFSGIRLMASEPLQPHIETVYVSLP